ncbi:nucleotidyltransferase family protein [Anaeromyxobacter oryzae]|uniref:nucleotidyltransferase family protein n=1 Tax=Anaeromyxobacter oryzae TaxID=2918170 RepID=UPI0020BDF37F|nr:nucleotidyltransferase family protein [Anaeromyxobacter oryzae]
MALLDAVRALTSFTPPTALPAPGADLDLLADVLVAHGLAPLASYQVEHTRLGYGLPASFREKLLGYYQGVVNDTVMKLVTLRGALKLAGEVPVVLLDAAAYVDWLYPHAAWRPVGDVRFALRAEDGARFAAAVKPALTLDRTEHGGRVAVFTDGKIALSAQEGLWSGGPADAPLFERARSYRAFGPLAARPSPEDAVLSTVAEQAQLGLFAPLITFVDLRELVGEPLDAAYVKARASALGLSRALHGAMALLAHFYPEVAEPAAALSPELGFAERVAVDRVVDAGRDPAKLRHLRGVDAAARAVVAP